MNILHIAAHLGGGAGKAISGIAIQDRRMFGDANRILLLQPPEKSGYVEECLEHGIPVELWDGDLSLLEWADVTVVSWWNHPAMARFLRSFPAVTGPVLLWSHVNGCHYPHLHTQLAQAFDGVLFTSPYSLQNPAWTEQARREIGEQGEIVLGMGRFDGRAFPPKTEAGPGGDFTVGYVGTLNYGKLHPEFVSYCKEACARIPNARFVMAGDRDGKLERDIRAAGLAERFRFPGYVSDVPSLMRSFDVFGYLLNPCHYGTTENVLLEAMACGVPPVVLEQNVEQFIVPPAEEHRVTGPEQYGERMEFLWRHPERRRALGRAARTYVLERFSAAENTARFQAACRRAVKKTPRDFSFLGDSPWAWFLYCLDGELRDRFEQAESPAAVRTLARSCPRILKEERKSSLCHFAQVYPEDKRLRFFSGIFEEERLQRGEETMPVVSVQRTDGDSCEAVKAAVDRVIGQLGGLEDIIKPGDRVMVKPNMVACPASRLSGCVTRWEVCLAICEAVEAVGGRPFLAESSAVGGDTEQVIAKCGYQKLRDRGIPVIDLKEKGNAACVMEVPGGAAFQEIHTWELVRDTDVFITVPVMKTHDQMEITLGMKNMKGLLVDAQKREFHRKGVAEGVVDWCAALKPALEIIDGTYGQEGPGPIFGRTRRMGLVIGSKDLVACEAVAGKIMGFEPEEVMITREACRRGLGEMDLDRIQVAGVPISEVESRFQRAGEVSLEGVPASCRLIYGQDACTGCRNTVMSALMTVKRRGLLSRLEGMNLCAGACSEEELPAGAGPRNTVCIGVCSRALAERLHCRYVIGCSPGNDDVVKSILADS